MICTLLHKRITLVNLRRVSDDPILPDLSDNLLLVARACAQQNYLRREAVFWMPDTFDFGGGVLSLLKRDNGHYDESPETDGYCSK